MLMLTTLWNVSFCRLSAVACYCLPWTLENHHGVGTSSHFWFGSLRSVRWINHLVLILSYKYGIFSIFRSITSCSLGKLCTFINHWLVKLSLLCFRVVGSLQTIARKGSTGKVFSCIQGVQTHHQRMHSGGWQICFWAQEDRGPEPLQSIWWEDKEIVKCRITITGADFRFKLLILSSWQLAHHSYSLEVNIIWAVLAWLAQQEGNGINKNLYDLQSMPEKDLKCSLLCLQLASSCKKRLLSSVPDCVAWPSETLSILLGSWVLRVNTGLVRWAICLTQNRKQD